MFIDYKKGGYSLLAHKVNDMSPSRTGNNIKGINMKKLFKSNRNSEGGE